MLVLIYIFNNRVKTEWGNGGEVGDVFERRYFPPEKEGKITFIRSFIMVAQTSTPNIIRSDVPAVFLAARPNRSLSLSATQLKTAAHLGRSKIFALTRK